MTKKNSLKIFTAGISASLALLPFMGLNIETMTVDFPNGEIVLPLVLGMTTLITSAIFLKFVNRGGKLGYYLGVTFSSFVLFSVFFSMIVNFLKYQSFPFKELVAGVFLAGFGTMVFWPFVLTALGCFVLSDLLIEKFVK